MTDYVPKTPLGAKLLELRKRIEAKGDARPAKELIAEMLAARGTS